MAIPINSGDEARTALQDANLAHGGGIPPSHVSFMAELVEHVLKMDNGLEVEREPKMEHGKFIVRLNEKKIFTIRSTSRGMWVEYFDPGNVFLQDDRENHTYTPITLKQQTLGQYGAYQMHKTGYFRDSVDEKRQIYALLDDAIEARRGL